MVIYKCNKCALEFDELDAVEEYHCPRCKAENKNLKRDLDLIEDVRSSSCKKRKSIPKFRDEYCEQ